MSKQPNSLRLADMADVTDRSTNWQEWKREAAAALRTQHAMLERARKSLKELLDDIDDPCGCPADDKWCPVVGAKETITDLTAHLEPKP